MLGSGGQRVGTRQIASAHAALDVAFELHQRLGLAVGLAGLGLQGGQLPRCFAQFTGQMQAGHLLGGPCQRCRSLRSA